MRKRLWKRTAAVTLAAVMAAGSVGIGGCGVTDKENGGEEGDSSGTAADAEVSGAKKMKSDGKDVAMGRYLEEDVPLPEGASDLADMRILDNGALRICYLADGRILYADSTDGGDTWGETKDLMQAMKINEKDYNVAYPKLGAGGDIFAFAYPVTDGVETDTGENGSTTKYYYLSAEGESKELDIGSKLSSGFSNEAHFSKNGTIIINDVGNGLKEFSLSDGSLVNSYEDGSYVSYFSVYENTLIAVMDETLHYYDLATGKPTEDMAPVTEKIASEAENLQLQSTIAPPVVFAKGNDESLFWTEKSGVYRYSPGGSVVEQVIDGSLNRISSPDTGVITMSQAEDGTFYLAIMDSSAVGGSSSKLLKYVYSKDMPAVPDTELTVYSLNDNDYIRQIAAVFQKENPDIYLNLEVGIEGDSAVTNTDALKNLNTEIMAGNGPDVLILDGIPEDTYVEKGMLKDISGILDKVQESDGLLENIRNDYVQEDGSQYVMPVKFAIPLMWGQEKDLDAATDNVALADMLESYQSEYSERNYPISLVMVGAEGFLRTVADVNEPAWLDENGDLNEDAVSSYLEQMNRIYQLGKASVEATEDARYERKIYSEDIRNFQGISGNAFSVMADECKLSLGLLYSPMNLAYIASAEREKEGLTHRLWNGQAQNCFVPSQTVGISAKTSYPEAAEKLLEFMFSQEGQNIGSDEGFPVNQAVYDSAEYWAVGNGDGEIGALGGGSSDGTVEIQLYINRADEATTKEIQDLGKSLTTAAKKNEIILSAVAENGAKYLEGECSLEEAVKAAGEEIGIYLAE